MPAIHLGAEDGRVSQGARDAILVCTSAGQMAMEKDETGSSEAVESFKVAERVRKA